MVKVRSVETWLFICELISWLVYALYLLIKETLYVLSLWLGKWDGVGAVIKIRLGNKKLQNSTLRLQNLGDVVTFLNEALFACVAMSSCQANRGPIHRHFYNVLVVALDRNNLWECDTIPGSQSLHSISLVTATDPMKLMVRIFSCFCGSCKR